MKKIIFPFVILLLLALSSCNSNPQSRHIPTGLVLSGGGAKCAAEIGVLEVIDSLNLEIDYIAGSSMGAVLGGLYAAGYSGKEIKKMWLEEDWLRVLKTDSKAEKNNLYFIDLVNGDEFEEQLRYKLNHAPKKGHRNKHIKFACTATRIVDKSNIEEECIDGNGKWKDVDWAKAIRASMTYPVPLVGELAGYSAVEINGMRLVDGGLMNNYPVDVVKSMGAKKIIAVDLNMKNHISKPNIPIEALDMIRSLFPKFACIEDLADFQWLSNWFMTRPDADRLEANRSLKGVIRIRPELNRDNLNTFNFSLEDSDEMIFQGRFAAKKMLNPKKKPPRKKKREHKEK
jgi:NTE family protein